MTPAQAREVLRVAAARAAEMAQFLYGPANADLAAQLIKEALSVDRASENRS